MPNALTRPVVAASNVLTLAMAAFSAWLHAWAGRMDEGHAVWQPVGPLAAIVVLAWLLTGLASLRVMLTLGRRAPLAVVAGGVAAAGLALMLFPR